MKNYQLLLCSLVLFGCGQAPVPGTPVGVAAEICPEIAELTLNGTDLAGGDSAFSVTVNGDNARRTVFALFEDGTSFSYDPSNVATTSLQGTWNVDDDCVIRVDDGLHTYPAYRLSDWTLGSMLGYPDKNGFKEVHFEKTFGSAEDQVLTNQISGNSIYWDESPTGF